MLNEDDIRQCKTDGIPNELLIKASEDRAKDVKQEVDYINSLISDLQEHFDKTIEALKALTSEEGQENV